MKALIPILIAGLLLGLAALLPQPRPPGEVGDYALLLELRERLPASLRELERLAGREDGVGWQARVALGRWHLRSGDPGAAVALLRSALALYATAEVRADLARALEATGRRAEALAEWKKLLPISSAVEGVIRLEGNPVRAAAALREGGAPKEALARLGSLGGAEAALERARALVALGRAADAVPELERYLAAFPAEASVWIEYGRALERAGDLEKALAAYRKAGTAGAYPAGLLLESLGRDDEALAAYRRSAEAEAKWRAARLLEARGQTSDALALYRELAQGTHRVRDDAALRLFLLHSRRGDEASAAEAARQLSPALAWLAGRPWDSPKLGSDPAPATPPAVSLASALREAVPGEGRAWAEVELGIALARASPVEKLAIGEWYAAQGDWRSAFRIGGTLLASLPCPRAYRLAYPLAWWDTVLRWAGAYGVDPYLVLAVIREESGFSPTAVSSSDARGPMQLLPSTARWIAEEKLKIPYREGDLFNPDHNIRLGTWYLRHLLDQFGGDLAWAVAAYNGGPGNLRRWTGGAVSREDLPAHLRSPETREYLGKVLGSWLVYRWLYGG
ncbi:MAG: transglycosylase SLT domain-containing protein [Candidatus Bipolaricaulota bacterium]|nr:transglycosylase SLT domain-containing protein [Candidatus Bipolaricaulota bacterium]